MAKANNLSPEWLSTVELARMLDSGKGKTRRALCALCSEIPEKIKTVPHNSVYYWYLHNDAEALEILKERLHVNSRNGDWVPVKVLSKQLGIDCVVISKALSELQNKYPDNIYSKLTAKNTSFYLRGDAESTKLLTEYLYQKKNDWLTVVVLMSMFKHSISVIKRALKAMQEYAPDRVKGKNTEKQEVLYLHKDQESIEMFKKQLAQKQNIGLSCYDMAKECGVSHETVRKIFIMLAEYSPECVTVIKCHANKKIFLHDDDASREAFYTWLKPKANMFSDVIKQKTR